MTRVVGFTGTRKGLTDAQRDALRRVLLELLPSEFHQGACVGADEEAVLLVRELPELAGCKIVAHPGKPAWGVGGDPYEFRSEAAMSASDRTSGAGEMPFLVRNKHIVSAAEVLVACPGAMEESDTGGTWYTVKYARDVELPLIVLCWPDGSVTQEERN